MAIVCKSPAEIEKMRQSGRVVRQVLDHLRTLVVPGATMMDLERAAEKRKLNAGDIVSIDCGAVLDGYYGDAAITVPVGEEVSPELLKLMKVTEESLYRGIGKALIGNSVSDIGGAVQE